MDELLKQIESCLERELFIVALHSTLTIPDICGALESTDGISTKEKYKTWFDNNLVKISPDKYGSNTNFSADDCYNYRCAILHLGKTNNGKIPFKKILFLEKPKTSGIESLHMVNVGSETVNKSLLINIEAFCRDMINAVNKWTQNNQDNKFYTKNVSDSIKRYPDGIAPVFGTSVIG